MPSHCLFSVLTSIPYLCPHTVYESLGKVLKFARRHVSFQITISTTFIFAEDPAALESFEPRMCTCVCPEQSRNLRDSEIELLKVGIPKMSADPGIVRIAGSVPELRCAQSWNVTHCWSFTLFTSFCNTFNYRRCYSKERKTKCRAFLLGNVEGALGFCGRNEVTNMRWPVSKRTSSEVHTCLILFLKFFRFDNDRLFSLTARKVRAVLILFLNALIRHTKSSCCHHLICTITLN